jgi:hypothetical protein
MPTVHREHGYRFFFFSNERQEPPHIHVEAAEKYAKFWIEPNVSLSRNVGFRTSEVTEAQQIITAHRTRFLQAWNEHFGKKNPASAR